MSKETLAFRLSFIDDNLRNLTGKILTIIDASIIDEKHNKAVKDIIKEVIGEKIRWIQEVAYTQKNVGVYGKSGYPFNGDVIEIK